MLRRFTVILTLVLYAAPPTYAQSAASKKFNDLTILYRLTEVCYMARKGNKYPYVTASQIKETKQSYLRQVTRMQLSDEEKSLLTLNVKKSEKVIVMTSLIRAGNFDAVHRDCANYRAGIFLSEYGF